MEKQHSIAGVLGEERFGFLSAADRAFILAFDGEMNRLGFDFGGQIGSGYCWGRYMAIYRRTGVKSDRVHARIYMRHDGIVLRLFLTGVEKHAAFISSAPAHIREVFTGRGGACGHCHNEHDGGCRFRKSYSIAGRRYDKCSGVTFGFREPSIERLSDYIALFLEFQRRGRG